MGRARLTRIDAVEEMAAAVDAFRTEAAAALEGLDMEIQRALDWIHDERREHWNHEVRRGWERITEARVQLQQAMTARHVGNHEPACIDEKKALAQAKRRLDVAQQKVEAVRHCAREVDRGVDEYRGARAPLSGWLEAEIPKALAALRRMMQNLEDYLALGTVGGGAAGVAGSGEQAGHALAGHGSGSREKVRSVGSDGSVRSSPSPPTSDLRPPTSDLQIPTPDPMLPARDSPFPEGGTA